MRFRYIDEETTWSNRVDHLKSILNSVIYVCVKIKKRKNLILICQVGVLSRRRISHYRNDNFAIDICFKI